MQVEQMAVQVQKIWQQRGWVQKAGTSAKFRSDRWSDRRFEGNRRANRSRVSEEHRRADRGFVGNRHAQVAGFGRKDVGRPRVLMEQTRADRGF